MNTRIASSFLCLPLIALLCEPSTSFAQDKENGTFTFAVIGDMPYSRRQAGLLDTQIGPALRDKELRFLVHLGDFKKAKTPGCSRGLFQTRKDQIRSLVTVPIFYTPGDNDWTDCDRYEGDGKAITSELQALDVLREVFFPRSKDDDKPKPLVNDDRKERLAFRNQRIQGYPENAIWRIGTTLFVTVHVVGARNGRKAKFVSNPKDKGPATFTINAARARALGWYFGKETDDAQTTLTMNAAQRRALEREVAVDAWLDNAFGIAGTLGPSPVVVAMHVDPTRRGHASCSAGNPHECDVFAPLRKKIGDFAKEDPNRPVLLMHGDSDPYCLDRNFGGREARNLWRLNGPGDVEPEFDAVLVTVSERSGPNPFTFESLLNKGTALGDCNKR